MTLKFQVDDKTDRIFLAEADAQRVAHSKIPVWDGSSLIGKIELTDDGNAELKFDHSVDHRGKEFRLDGVAVVEDRIVSVDLRWL